MCVHIEISFHHCTNFSDFFFFLFEFRMPWDCIFLLVQLRHTNKQMNNADGVNLFLINSNLVNSIAEWIWLCQFQSCSSYLTDTVICNVSACVYQMSDRSLFSCAHFSSNWSITEINHCRTDKRPPMLPIKCNFCLIFTFHYNYNGKFCCVASSHWEKKKKKHIAFKADHQPARKIEFRSIRHAALMNHSRFF